jgi:apolipoprotein N-acyltransferase
LYRYLRWFLQKYSSVLSAAVGFCLAGLLQSFSGSAHACATCYGDPNSPLTQGTIVGVWFLVAVIVSVLAGIAYIGYSWHRKARSLNMEV